MQIAGSKMIVICFFSLLILLLKDDSLTISIFYSLYRYKILKDYYPKFEPFLICYIHKTFQVKYLILEFL